MSTFRLSFLGPVQLIRNSEAIGLNAAKAVALLAYLAVTGAAQSRDHLIDLLWPDSLPEAGRKNLRNTLWTIRKALGDELLLAETDRLALADGVWVDTRVFEATAPTQAGVTLSAAISDLPAALELYRGPLLDGLILADAPDFEVWLTTERERFGQLYLRALESLVALQRDQELWSEVVTTARQALAFDNLQEPLVRALMEAHARLGERAEALRQYDRLRSTLAEELGVEPLPETEALRAAILEGKLHSRKPPPTSPAPLARPPRADIPSAAAPFVGRQAEMAALTGALQVAAAGQARIVLISGEMGVGKSRLWQAWSATLPPELTVLATRGLDTTRSLPFISLTGLFRQSGCLQYLASLRQAVSPIWLAELARLLPEIRQYWPDVPAPAMLPPEEERHRLFEALTQLLQAFDKRPLVLFIDDLHWVDRATLDWLVYLIERLRGEPLLLVGAYRSSEVTTQLAHLVAGWSRQGLVQRLPLARFTLAETASLIAALGIDEQLAEQLQARSDGNPYFLIELSRALPDETPPSLVELIQARLNQLPDGALQLVQAAAVLETDFDFATLSHTSGLAEEETLTLLDNLLDAGILIERESRYDFSHALVASIVRNSLSLARRSFLHRRTAAALEAVHAGQVETVAGQLARHYAQAGRPPEAARYAELAGQRALELTAPAEAVAFYRQAVQLEPTPARRLGLGEALTAEARLEEARQQFRLAAQEFESAGDCLGASRAYLALGFSFMVSGQGQQVVHWAEQALAILESQPDPAALARAHQLWAAGGLQAGHTLAQAEAHLVEAIRLTSDNNLLELASVGRFELGNLLAQRGDLTKALESFEEALELAKVSGELFQQVLAHNNLAYHATLAGDLARARQEIEAGLELVEKHALVVPRQYLYSTRGELALAEGELVEAEAWFDRALIEAQRNDNRSHAANIRANLGLVARERGDLDHALLLLEEARAGVAGLAAPHLQSKIDLWLAELYLQREEQAAAAEALKQAQARLADGERRGLLAWAGRVQARLDS